MHARTVAGRALMLTTFAAALLLAAGHAAAQAIQVEAVQYPAWLERGGHAVPLTPGIALQSADTLRTGANARVQLKLAEGSTVKLGENARFTVERVENRGVFRSALNVLYGAFRFTTGALGARHKRELDIRVRTITAGIRGTDLWGKSTDARDLVCLLEGRVSARAEGREAVILDKPRDFYQRARDGEPQLGRVDEKQVREWSKETDIEAGAPAARVGGRWRVIASKFYGRNDALSFSRELRARGFPAEVSELEGGVQRVEIRGLAGEAEARALMAMVRDVPGVNIPSIAEDPLGR
jgi:FecR-like protein